MSKLPKRSNRMRSSSIELLSVLAMFASLSGCGGGSGGGSSSTVGGAAVPTASSSSLLVNEDVATSGTLIARDTDGDRLTYSIVRQGTLGNAVISDVATGAFTYTPTLHAVGTDSFTFKANDGASDSNTATVTVTIVSVNDAPVAQSGSLLTIEDTPAASTLVAIDPDPQTLTYSIVTNGTRGTATVTDAATGAFIYVPAANVSGSDTITFKANDGVIDSNIATIAINIFPSNDPPIAQPGSLTINEDTTGAGILTATDVELQSLTYSVVANGSLGTATITNSSSGAYLYVPDPNANGTDTFTFQATDGLANSNVETVTVTITPVNDAPVATGSCNTTRKSLTFSGTLTATDPESPALLMYSLADGSTGPLATSNGGQISITDATTGAFTYTPRAGKGGRGRDTFTFRVTDSNGATGSATETVIVDQAIMPLGDSITGGTVNGPVPPTDLRVGYRKPLYDTLLASGYTFDFVGSLTDGYAVPDFDFNHEGHGGWTAAEIGWGRTGYPTDGVRAWLNANPADVVLLHAGTNALDRNNDIDVEVILDEIDQWEVSANGNPVTVILALIVDQDPLNPEVTAFNNNVLAMANPRIAAGDEIIIANHHDALSYPADMANQLHPNNSGYSKMATVWFNKLTAVLDKCP